MTNIIFIAAVIAISVTVVLDATLYTMIVSDFIRDRKNNKKNK